MFQRLPETRGATVRVAIDGQPHEARDGDTVAAAMLAAGFDHCRTTPVSDSPRSPYCMMGVCFDCGHHRWDRNRQGAWSVFATACRSRRNRQAENWGDERG
jgi:hypothetical protein